MTDNEVEPRDESLTDEQVDEICADFKKDAIENGGIFFCPWIGTPRYVAHRSRKMACLMEELNDRS